MNFLECRRLLISTLSPVHVGCGEDYDPTRYVIEDDTLYEFEPGAALAALTAQDRDQLLKIVSSPANDRMLQQVQAFFYHRRQALISTASRRVPVGPKMVAFYQKRVGKTVQVEGDGSQLLNRLEIERNFFNPANGAPVLPGSSLKGAMRTALLDAINAGQPLPGQENNLAMQQRLFQYREFEQDPMRLVQLADALFQDGEGVGSELRFAVNRRRKPPKPGERSAQSQAEQRGLYQLLECVPATRFRAFAGRLTVQRLEGVTDRRDRLPAADLRWNVSDIAAACNRFYRHQLEAELNQMQERGYLDADWAALLDRLLGGLAGERLNRNEAFLLRVGRHSGAESVTLNGTRNIKILLGKDVETGKQRFEYRATGTSRWLAASDIQDRAGMLPFGWLLVELHPAESESPDWLETREILTGFPTEYTAWIERERQRTRQRAETEARRKAEEQARQQAAATEAALSPEQKAIAELRRWFEEDRAAKRKEPGGRLANRLNDLLKDGLSWPAAECETLAQLAEAIYGYLDWGSGKKKQERKAKIQQLRKGSA
ncbi:MAG: CRISPR-associated protein Csm5 [Candidatus Contendobacter sp.]|nr:MAG: CRISPR-associated protein Csm5 [Candidatus Contendobacter sp.]